MPTPYHPPITITPRQLTRVGEICERIGRWVGRDLPLSPQLRKANRIRSIQASLAIKNNSLSIDTGDTIQHEGYASGRASGATIGGVCGKLTISHNLA